MVKFKNERISFTTINAPVLTKVIKNRSEHFLSEFTISFLNVLNVPVSVFNIPSRLAYFLASSTMRLKTVWSRFITAEMLNIKMLLTIRTPFSFHVSDSNTIQI